MNEHRGNEEREALIADERALEPDEAAELSLLADVLGDPSTWAEPSADLENAVVQAVDTAEPATPMRDEHRPRRWRVGVSVAAAAAAIAIALGTFSVVSSSSSADFTANLSATALAPTSGASAHIDHTDSGFRVRLVAHGLPKLPTGEYYQAWLKNGAGTLVPIGTFSASDNDITLWSGVSPKDFPTLTVTIEAADNNQESSGRRVLVGDVRAH
jgi:anti-sigma-K factor RskA